MAGGRKIGLGQNLLAGGGKGGSAADQMILCAKTHMDDASLSCEKGKKRGGNPLSNLKTNITHNTKRGRSRKGGDGIKAQGGFA